MKKVAILDYGVGNLYSLKVAFERLGVSPVITADKHLLMQANKVVFPGVGAAGLAMDKLKASGANQWLAQLTTPVMGICLGMQLMCNWLEEGEVDGLGIFDQEVVKIPGGTIVPHMGWNNIEGIKGPLFDGLE